MHGLAEDGPQHRAEEADARASARGLEREPFSSTKREPITISQPLSRRRFVDARDIARVVLAVAVHADHVLVAQFVRQLVAGLHAAAQTRGGGAGRARARRPRAPRRRWHRPSNRRSPAPGRRAARPGRRAPRCATGALLVKAGTITSSGMVRPRIIAPPPFAAPMECAAQQPPVDAGVERARRRADAAPLAAQRGQARQRAPGAP